MVALIAMGLGASLPIILISLLFQRISRNSFGSPFVCVLAAAFVAALLTGFGEGEGGFQNRVVSSLTGAGMPAASFGAAFAVVLALGVKGVRTVLRGAKRDAG
jgi:hypothetical protein